MRTTLPDKMLHRTSLALPDRIEKLARSLIAVHQCESFSDYFIGLILLDALLTNGELDCGKVEKIPTWILKSSKVLVRDGKMMLAEKSR
jgi:hypothetical protein